MLAVSALLFCVIVAISDGDTLTARSTQPAGRPPQMIPVRLAAVDAPENHQPFGACSRENLAVLCFGQHADMDSSQPVACSTDAGERSRL
jgi:endonuclease YncB( thermonuclease family)